MVKVLYGGDYNPEQWSTATWHADAELMARARVDVVRLPVFGWSRIQADEGEFDADWLDEVLDILARRDIRAILATATASIPVWALRRYPDIVAVDADGTRFGPGSRQHYAPASPDYARLAAELAGFLGRRYADHPSVLLWNVNNEYGCHVHADYSTHAEVAFRRWLERRYGTVDALNAAWGTSFWSQRYSDFDEVQPPRKAPYSINPGQALDFRRYTSDQLLELFRMEKDVLRRSGATQPVTTNFMGAFKPVDYWAWARHVDVVADDSYPDPADPDSFRESAFARDLMRALKPGQPWLLMEQAPNAVNWRDFNAAKAPGQMAATSIQAVGRGADGVMFFQWRQSAAGSEKFHSAMLPHAGTASRTWGEVVALGESLAELGPLGDADAGARVAVLFDWDSWWAVEAPDLPGSVDYLEAVRSWHRALHARNIPVDFVPVSSIELARYDVVIAPLLYLVSDEGAHRLRGFVSDGGHLVAGPLTDVVDQSDRFLPDGFLTRLGKVFGARVMEYDAFGPDAAGRPVAFEGDREAVGVATRLTEGLEVDGDATVLARTDTRVGAAQPVVVSREHGRGRGTYVGTILDRAGLERVLDHVLGTTTIGGLGSSDTGMVEVSRRGDVLAVVNHGVTSARVALEDDGSASAGVGSLDLEPFAWAILDGSGVRVASRGTSR